MRASFDWEAIRAYYDAGHTVRECQRRFGFGGSSWAKAVQAGLVVPRVGGRGHRNLERRREIRRLVDEGLNRVEIAERLGISMATVAYYARALGLARDERCIRRYDWAEVQRYHDMGHTVRECMERFGFASQTWHKAKERGDIQVRPRAAPLSTYLVEGRYVSRGHLKGRLLAEGLKQPACEECGISSWRGRRLGLALHHVNGNGDDNRLENLQLLCPNCHSQTPNFSARNIAGSRRMAA